MHHFSLTEESLKFLHEACSRGYYGIVKALLTLPGIKIDELDENECSPLCIAIKDEHFDIAKALIEAGADPNGGSGPYGSPLHLAVVRADLQITDMLIKRGAEVNVADLDGNTPLHFVMNVFTKGETKYKAIAESLMMSGAKPNSRNKEFWGPLHIAARKGYLEAIKWAKMVNVILAELNMETFDFNFGGGAQKWSILHLASCSGHQKVVEEILDWEKEIPINVFARTMENRTAR